MKKFTNNEDQWYTPDSNLRRPTATLKGTGVLCLGTQMRRELSSGRIRIKLDQKENAIIVEENLELGFKFSRNGEVKIFGIARELQQCGIKLPAVFWFFYNREESFWKGYLVPSPRKSNVMQREKIILSDERTSIYNGYKWMIDKVIYNQSKSTPIEDRRAIAAAALWEAICNYTQMQGDFKGYLIKEMKSASIKQNKLYVKESLYRHISLDSFVDGTREQNAEVCELWLPRYKNEMIAVENRMYLDAFRKAHLNVREKEILKRLLEGYTATEIQFEWKVTELELFECCKTIGERWERYNLI